MQKASAFVSGGLSIPALPCDGPGSGEIELVKQ
jgi:hypothetical protein